MPHIDENQKSVSELLENFSIDDPSDTIAVNKLAKSKLSYCFLRFVCVCGIINSIVLI